MTKKKKKTVQKVIVKRDEHGKFLKGSRVNPFGRPRGGEFALLQTKLDALLKSVQRVESKKNIQLLDHFVERAYESDPVLIAVMKKLIPDLKAVEVVGLGAVATLSVEQAEGIREELKKRFGKRS